MLVRWLRRNPSATLFSVQLLGILVYPYMGTGGIGRAAFNAFAITVVILALRAARRKNPAKGLKWVGPLLAVPAATLLLVQAIVNEPTLAAWSSAFEAGLYFYATYSTIRYLLYDEVVSADELWAVGSAFTLLAWAFAHVFVVTQAVVPGSFGEERTWFELLFLSVTTLSAVGLSDIVPGEGAARSAVMLEEIFGLGYTVMLVSRVVALTVLGRR